MCGDGDLGLFRLFRKGHYLADLALYVLPQAAHVLALNGLDQDLCPSLGSRGSNLLDAFQILDRLLDSQNDALLHLLRAGPGIGDDHTDRIQGELGKDLLLDIQGHDQTAD